MFIILIIELFSRCSSYSFRWWAYSSAYVGMIVSKHRVRGVMDQLLNEGFLKEKLDKVNTPTCLSIGAITPEEIECFLKNELYKKH